MHKPKPLTVLWQSWIRNVRLGYAGNGRKGSAHAAITAYTGILTGPNVRTNTIEYASLIFENIQWDTSSFFSDLQTASAVSSLSSDAKVIVQPISNQQPGKAQLDDPLTPPNKDDCLFCILGLCKSTHRSTTSFLLSDTKVRHY